jgi:hypothetical protein
VVSRRRGASGETGRVRRPSNGNHLALVVHEKYCNIDRALVFNAVLDEVLAIVVVIELIGDLLTIISLYRDLELVTT